MVAECCALAGHGLRPIPLRRRAGRPQLKRDPLGRYVIHVLERYQVTILVASVGLLHACRDRHPKPSSQEATGQGPALAASTPESGLRSVDTSGFDSVSHVAGLASDTRGVYVGSVFDSTIGELPKIGWFLSKRFLTSERHSHVYVFSTDSTLAVGQFGRVITASEHDSIARRYQLACDTKGPLAEYELSSAPPIGIERAFYISRLPPGPVRVGLHSRGLLPKELAAARALLAVPQSAVRYRDTALAVSAGKPSYSFNAVYDSSTGALLKTALALHDTTGGVIAYQLRERRDFECDGCGEPTFDEGLGRLYGVLNAFEWPGFQYAVLLLDTSTVEGRALSFVTFTPEGTYSEYRIYEYVVTCILDDNP